MTEPERIFQTLKDMARLLNKRGYGTPYLIFSDASYVRTNHWAPSAFEEIEALLAQGERPIGFIARPRFGKPRAPKKAAKSAGSATPKEFACTPLREGPRESSSFSSTESADT